MTRALDLRALPFDPSSVEPCDWPCVIDLLEAPVEITRDDLAKIRAMCFALAGPDRGEALCDDLIERIVRYRPRKPVAYARRIASQRLAHLDGATRRARDAARIEAEAVRLDAPRSRDEPDAGSMHESIAAGIEHRAEDVVLARVQRPTIRLTCAFDRDDAWDRVRAVASKWLRRELRDVAPGAPSRRAAERVLARRTCPESLIVYSSDSAEELFSRVYAEVHEEERGRARGNGGVAPIRFSPAVGVEVAQGD